MGIVKYFEQDGQKTFDVIQALNDSGWGIPFDDILDTTGLRLVDRTDESHKVTVSAITLDHITKTYFVHFKEGGWLCLDNAIEQFTRAIIPNTNEI